MLLRHPLPLLALACLLSACGGQEPADSDTAAAPAEQSAPAEPVDLQVDAASLPSPCDLLLPATAQELLQAEAPAQENLINQNAVARLCRYKTGEGEQQRYLSLQLSVVPASMMSSAHDSREALIARATELAGGVAPSAVVEDVGIVSFVFDSEGATLVQVLTGMGGADPETGEPVSELQLGYSLSNGDLDPQQRSEALLRLARINMSQLQAGGGQ